MCESFEVSHITYFKTILRIELIRTIQVVPIALIVTNIFSPINTFLNIYDKSALEKCEFI